MTPTLFLAFAGPTSLFIGILGILDPGFSPELWFDLAENIVHTGFGLLALFIMTLSPLRHKQLVLWSSILAGLVAIGGLLMADQEPPNFFITNLEHPIDNALHLTFAITGLVAVWTSRAKHTSA